MNPPAPPAHAHVHAARDTAARVAAPPAGARRRVVAWGPIAVLTAAVAAAHLALLDGLPMAPSAPPPPVTASFVMRTLQEAPPPVVVAAPVIGPQPARAEPASPPPSPRSRTPRTTPVAAKPKPTAQPAPPPEAPATPPEAATSPANIATASVPDPVPTAIPSAPGASDAPAPTAPSVPTATPVPQDAASPAGTIAATSPDPARDPPAAAVAAAAPGPATPAGPLPSPMPEAPLSVPSSVRLKFAVTGQQGTVPLQGVFGELAWSQDGRAYDARLTLRFLFKTLRTQHSSGAIGPTGIEPDRFSDTRKTEVASHFVRDQGQVVFSSNAPAVPLMAGAQDRLSVMLQLGALLAGDPARYPEDGAVAIQTVGPRDADIWLFKIGAQETLQLPAGEVVARRFTRNPRKPFDDTVELWLAPSLGWLPVRIRLTQPGGDFADMQLRERLPGSEAR